MLWKNGVSLQKCCCSSIFRYVIPFYPPLWDRQITRAVKLAWAMSKTDIRDFHLDKRMRLDCRRHRLLGEQVQQELLRSRVFRSATALALYSPIKKEVDTGLIFSEAIAAHKRVFYPKVVADAVRFYEVKTISNLTVGSFNVLEPGCDHLAEAGVDDLDLIVVPGVAFDLTGRRLGYGRGYYDRLLVDRSRGCVTVGLCFESQLEPILPTEEHDRPVDYLATEDRFIPCSY